jgi:hypothetical protein
MLQTSVKVSKRIFAYESKNSEFEAPEFHILNSRRAPKALPPVDHLV